MLSGRKKRMQSLSEISWPAWRPHAIGGTISDQAAFNWSIIPDEYVTHCPRIRSLFSLCISSIATETQA